MAVPEVDDPVDTLSDVRVKETFLLARSRAAAFPLAPVKVSVDCSARVTDLITDDEAPDNETEAGAVAEEVSMVMPLLKV
jgi:hypothetical protein